MQTAIKVINELVEVAGKPEWTWQPPAKDEALIAKAQKCPQPYAAIGGMAYFLADTAHPDRFLFFSIGQYVIPLGTDRTWQSSIVFLTH